MSKSKIVSWEEWSKWVNKQLDGHQAKLILIESRLNDILDRFDPMYATYMEAKVLETLRNEGKPRTWAWIQRRLGCLSYDPVQNLIKKGLVTTTRSGYHTMHACNRRCFRRRRS